MNIPIVNNAIWIQLTSSKKAISGFTLAEAIIAMAISVIFIGAIIYGYILSANRAEWTGYSLAANSLAQQKMEQTRACKWDPQAVPIVDELVATNFPTERNIMDIPISKTNVVWATNFTTITSISTDPPLRCVRVDCVWSFMGRRNHTNTVVTYRAPDA